MKTLFNQNAEEEINDKTFQAAKKKRQSDIKNIQSGDEEIIYFIRPQDFDNSLKIADQIKEHSNIVLNFNDTDNETASRMTDFLSGAVYACKAKINQIGNNTFLITSPEVELMGELAQEQPEEEEFPKSEIEIS